MQEIRNTIEQNRTTLVAAVATIFVLITILFFWQLSRLERERVEVHLEEMGTGKKEENSASASLMGDSSLSVMAPGLQVDTPDAGDRDKTAVPAHRLYPGGLAYGPGSREREGSELLEWPEPKLSLARPSPLLERRIMLASTARSRPASASGAQKLVPGMPPDHFFRQPAPLVTSRPRIALVIDDWGYDWKAAADFLRLDIPLTAAVLPYGVKTREQVRLLRERGFEVILHLPMEPLDGGIDPGPGAILTKLSDAEIRHRVEASLRAVPGVVGVNNHMGSKATSDTRVMRVVLETVKEQGLFFLDSRTAPTSVVAPLATRLGVPYAVNRLFLDHYAEEERIKAQLRRLVDYARCKGQAIGIGHVRPHTYRAIVEMLPYLRAEGIVIVPVSALVTRPEVVAAASPTSDPGEAEGRNPLPEGQP